MLQASVCYMFTINKQITITQTRLNPIKGLEQIWVNPDGLTGLWVTRGFCDHCEVYKEMEALAI
jgi:hypothetical protein